MKYSPVPTNTPHPMALRLGYLGMLPFVIFAALTWMIPSQSNPDGHWYMTFFLSSYAAVSVSLLGGIHWGLAFHSTSPTPMAFIWGVLPPAVSWLGAVLPPHIGLIIHSIMLIACYLVDRKVYASEKASDWLTMRFRLTMVASASCILAVIGTTFFR
ncbi:MAG: DUF3429 domain-containing protein [Burkholderiales bacterium]|jgi:hypothetical protein